MISGAAAFVIGAATFLGSFTSGIFGMVGGQIILGVLLYYLPVSSAMTVFSGLMFTSGAWRGYLWRQHVDWPLTVRYIAGSAAGYGVMTLIMFVPPKPMIYLGLGLAPIIGDLLPKRFAPDITRRGVAALAGFIIMVLQIAVGAAGNLLDMFFQASDLDRKTIVATKAVTQLFSQVMRFVYFSALALEAGDHAPWWLFGVYVLLTFAGGSAAAGVLNRISDASFRKWTKSLIYALSIAYVARGSWLLWVG